MERMTRRAEQVGMTTLVLDSGPARAVPAGSIASTPSEQLIEFGKICGEMAAKAGGGVTIVPRAAQPRASAISSTRCPRRLEIVRAVNHPNFQCMLDTYHFWQENEPLENLATAMKWIKHVHVADKDGRACAGRDGELELPADLRAAAKTRLPRHGQRRRAEPPALGLLHGRRVPQDAVQARRHGA